MEEEIKTLRLQNQALRKLKARTRGDFCIIFFLTIFFVVGLGLIYSHNMEQMNEQIIELQKHKFAIFDEPMDKQKYLYYYGCENQSDELIRLHKYIDDIHVNCHVNCLVGLVGGA